MSGFLKGLMYGAVLIAAGWFLGSLYPAPEQFTAPIKGRTDELVASIDFSPEAIADLRRRLTPEQYSTMVNNMAEEAARTGDAVVIERDALALADNVHAMEAMEAAAVTPAIEAGADAFETYLTLCPQMTVSNAPPANDEREVENYSPRVDVDGVILAIAPTRGACLSSGFGPRSGGQHKGIDLHSEDGGPILAAGDGVVVEKKYRDDFGNMILIDHGNGVFTRYAHLSTFTPGINVGATVTAGQQIGLMGNTASYRIPIHLHYELLRGNYQTQKRSFGLTPASPFDFPAAT